MNTILILVIGCLCVVLYFRLEKLMGGIASELTTIKGNLDSVTTSVTTLATGITTLVAKIAALTSQASGDELSPATQALLDGLASEGSNLQAAATAAVAELPGS